MLRCCSFKDNITSSDNRLVINTTSNSDTWSRGLSPFYLKNKSYDNYESCVENIWQFSKCYKQHLGEDNLPNSEWYKWRLAGFNSFKPIRYPFGKNTKPEFLYWNNKKYLYIESRKCIYSPLYGNAVLKSEAFNILKNEYIRSKQNRFDLYLKDFDAYDFHSENMSFEDVLHNTERKFGHSFVLYFLLRKIVDNITDIKLI